MHMTTVVHVLRHGQVDNPTGVLYGRVPGYHLSALGHTMAQRAAQVTATLPLTYLCCSPLERARETIAPICEQHPGLELAIDERLIEAENRFAGEPFTWRGFVRHPQRLLWLANPLTPSWGEPYHEVAARMRDAILDAAQQAGEGGQALLVSHQLPIWIARLSAEAKPLAHLPTSRQCSLASITSFTVENGRCTSVSYQETSADLLSDKARRSPISTSTPAS
ncbi:MAG: histidine phosphatase family protein [Propionibacteriaceae bacterium]